MIHNEIKVVIFDIDDTLIPNVIYYKQVKKKIVKLFKEIFGEAIDEEKLLARYAEIDLARANKIGLSRSRFSLSAVELYMEYCKEFSKKYCADDLDNVFITANTVFDIVEQLPQATIDVIEQLKSEGYKVFALTSGDEIIQTYKIYKSNIYLHFDKENIINVPIKTDDTYTEFFKKYGFENCVMIGNSKKSDIIPALNVGMYAIHIPEETWEFEKAVLQESTKLYTISSIKKVPGTVKNIFKPKCCSGNNKRIISGKQ